MLDLVGLNLDVGGTVLLADVSARVLPRARVGVVGANGSGKSSLLRLIAGELEPADGHVRRPPGLRVGFLRQEVQESGSQQSLLAFVREPLRAQFDQLTRLEDLERQLETMTAEQVDLLDRYQELRDQLEAEDAFAAPRRVEEVLDRLGVARSAWPRPLSTFSGGERTILALARLLVTRPELLLMDEPTNHLDLDGIEWFEQFIASYEGAVVLVSHDRALLDRTTTQTWELFGQKLTSYQGNYSAYRQALAEDEIRRARALKVQNAAIDRLEFQIARLKAWANVYDNPDLARRARSMERRIERMDEIEAPRKAARAMGLKLDGSERHGRIALQLRGYRKQLGERLLFEGAELEVEYGERVAVVGPNGSGKSTLLRDVAANADWENTTLRIGKSARIAYVSQLFEQLDDALSLVDQVLRETELTISESRALLFSFKFTAEDVERQVGTLSGGEKCRLQLACLMAQDFNLLILDEPTNHLDVDSREVLENALEAFEGTLLLVSHDRYFLEKLVGCVVAIEHRTLRRYEQTFAAYRADQPGAGLARVGGIDEPAPARPAAAPAKKARRDPRAERTLQRTAEKLESQIDALGSDKAALERELAEAYSTGDDAAAARLSSALDALLARIGQAEGAWEDTIERLEAAGR